MFRALLLFALLLPAVAHAAEVSWPSVRKWARGQEIPREPRSAPPGDERARKERGEVLYGPYCARCHGFDGRGGGAAGQGLDPMPANLVEGPHRYADSEGRPSERALFRVITGGLHRSAMPAFADLPESDRWALAAYVRSLSTAKVVEALQVKAPADLDSAKRVARGREAFSKACGSCHNAMAILGPNFHKELPRRGRGPVDLFAAIRYGIPGTAMPPRVLEDDATWDLVAYLRSILPPRHTPGSQEKEALDQVVNSCSETPPPGGIE